MEKTQYDRAQLLSVLANIAHRSDKPTAAPAKSPKGKQGKPADRPKLEKTTIAGLMQRLHKTYFADVILGATSDPELFAHFLAWTYRKSEVRDLKVVLPAIALRGLLEANQEFAENAVAHMLLLDQRNLVRAVQYNSFLVTQNLPVPHGYRRLMEDGLKKYLRALEKNRARWEGAAVGNRAALVKLYNFAHLKAAPFAEHILFERDYPEGSVFKAIASLKGMSPQEAAGTILQHKIPVQVAIGAVAKAKDKDVIMALLDQMTGSQLAQNTQMLSAFGVMKDPVLKDAYEKARKRAGSTKQVGSLKVSKVLDTLSDLDHEMAEQLVQMQERQLERLGGIEGNWMVAGDCSSSMQESIRIAVELASLLAKQVKGNVYLVFFNDTPRLFDVSGKTLEQIRALTKGVHAAGMTSIGSSIQLLTDKKLMVNGIALVSDGGENSEPMFESAYKKYASALNVEPTVYHFHVPGDPNKLSKHALIAQRFEITAAVDHNSLPNLVATLKTGRYGLLDEIFNTPLLTVAKVTAH